MIVEPQCAIFLLNEKNSSFFSAVEVMLNRSSLGGKIHVEQDGRLTKRPTQSQSTARRMIQEVKTISAR